MIEASAFMAEAGGVTPSRFAHSSRSAAVWQQQSLQHRSAESQPQWQFSQGKRSENNRRGVGSGTPMTIAAYHNATSVVTTRVDASRHRLSPCRDIVSQLIAEILSNPCTEFVDRFF
ncbi:MAG: hypothetical protein JNL18_25030 [Planctomycetaceae bacterium]|nr:hypothetical protein [Planctomycetaceae bacterium]